MKVRKYIVQKSRLYNNKWWGPEWERGESEGPRIAASLFLINRTTAFNDLSRWQPVIGQIELRILALVKPYRTHPN